MTKHDREGYLPVNGWYRLLVCNPLFRDALRLVLARALTGTKGTADAKGRIIAGPAAGMTLLVPGTTRGVTPRMRVAAGGGADLLPLMELGEDIHLPLAGGVVC